jgi:hypothetical protein
MTASALWFSGLVKFCCCRVPPGVPKNMLPQKSDCESYGARHAKAWELCLSPVQVVQIRFRACQSI